MRRFVAAMTTCVVVAALGAACAGASTVAQFVANKGSATGALATKGASGTSGHQQLKLGPFTIECAEARTTGSVTNDSESLLDSVKLKGCTTTGTFGEEAVPVAVKVENQLELEYESQVSSSKLTAAATIDIKPIGCSIQIAPGTLVNELAEEENEETFEGLPYANEQDSTIKLKQFPTGFQHKLRIDNEWGGIHYSFAGACAQTPSGEEGKYSGLLSDEVVKGNLELELPESGWNRVKNETTLGGNPIT